MRIDAALRAEADELLAGGLYGALASFGAVHVVGSYMMELMAWRDLDIHLVPTSLDRASFFALGAQLAELLEPRRMQFRDERIAAEEDLPSGLYWGVYLGDERAGAWKLDIWATEPPGLQRVHTYCEGIRRRLSPKSRELILSIKAQLWQSSDYRKRFGSGDIYKAVLDHGVTDLRGFWAYLELRAPGEGR